MQNQIPSGLPPTLPRPPTAYKIPLHDPDGKETSPCWHWGSSAPDHKPAGDADRCHEQHRLPPPVDDTVRRRGVVCRALPGVRFCGATAEVYCLDPTIVVGIVQRGCSPSRPGTRTQELHARRRTVSSRKAAAIETIVNGDSP